MAKEICLKYMDDDSAASNSGCTAKPHTCSIETIIYINKNVFTLHSIAIFVDAAKQMVIVRDPLIYAPSV